MREWTALPAPTEASRRICCPANRRAAARSLTRDIGYLDGSAGAAAAAPVALAKLEANSAAAGAKVAELKKGGADKEQIDAAVAALLAPRLAKRHAL